ncbi:TOX high mobility group box family member 4-B-like isoform X2 [Rhopilema esculentum]|uniref:TOX high mobility group box family member 4-B-like isoform X2 n=1 Tax=Rhopilema esculentum TaxID=499914 RepID=UPI0031E17865
MASEAPDPSSSELLTDFDIADVDNWDDQNDSSKQLGSSSPTLPYPSAEGHDYVKAGNSSINAQALLQSQQRASAVNESMKSKQPQSGHALETLRALALAQEEQARKLKEEQERAMLLQQQSKSTAGTSPKPQATNLVQQGIQLTGNGAPGKQVCIPLTSLKLPVNDSKNKNAKGNSVLQLRGQLVKTPDQKLMLVTEVAGKKVGYLICPQSGQLQTAAMSVASQLASKATQGNAQSPSPVQVTQSAQSPVTSISSLGSSSPSYPVFKATSPAAASTNFGLETDANENTGLREEPSPMSVDKQASVTVSSDEEDDSSLSEVAASLQNTHIQPAVLTEKKKKRGRPKKKKDKNEPVKPISPYLMFFKDVQLRVRQENPKAGLGEVSKMISKLWEQASKEEKQIYLAKSAKEKEEYRIKLAEYKASIGEGVGDGSGRPNAQLTTIENASYSEMIDESSNSGHNNTPMVVLSSDSSPEKNGSELDSGVTSGVQFATAQSSSMDTNDVQIMEPPPVRKRGRPRTKNLLPSNVKKEPKKTKKKEKIVSEDRPTPKLTMKINIRNSQITESPTKALEDLSKTFSDDRVEEKHKEEHEEKHDEDIAEEDDIEDQPKPTQPKSLMSFKIPLKKNRSTGSSDQKESAIKESETDSQTEKASVPAVRICANNGCENPAKISKERGPLYCSSRCLVNHCRNVFDAWVDERKEESVKNR